MSHFSVYCVGERSPIKTGEKQSQHIMLLKRGRGAMRVPSPTLCLLSFLFLTLTQRPIFATKKVSIPSSFFSQ
uniref:Subtilisin-like protein protease n=1 Tax=Rhizophora mucronata TaxID=61149 RepID=A0A2P2KIU7_RHIMU